MRWDAAAITDRGRRRPENEDAFLLRPDLGLFAVADGLGGHAGGEVASGLAIETVEHILAGSDPAAGTQPPPGERLRDAILAAHRRILERAADEPRLAGMGTTLTLLALDPAERAFRIAHVGDSRAYLLRDGALSLLTTDHTLAQDQIARGRLDPAHARGHPLSHILTRALGTAEEDVEVDLIQGEVRAADLFLLCSDGLTGVLDDGDLRAILEGALALETLAAQLVEAANLRGGPDNITAVLVRVEA
jgi:protein phosphatase